MGAAPRNALLAVDVGTLSARAGLFEPGGGLLAVAARPFELMRPEENHATYRMGDIWAAVCEATKACLDGMPGAAASLAAVAFDATSSLFLQAAGAPPLDGGGDVICWMDHRGEAEAAAIDASGHRFLTFLGGSISPEMHLPKLLWLKRRRPADFARLTAARDLCDELAFRATGVVLHSVCGLSCKWPYLPTETRPWCEDLLERFGMSELSGLGGLGGKPGRVGDVHGRVSTTGSLALGIPEGVPVAVGLIDAEAGALGVLGRGFRERMNEVLPMIGGTSTCYMPFAAEARSVPGVWGPFKDAVFPGFWMHEGGQSLSGAALDAVLAHHPASPSEPSAAAHAATAKAVLARLDAEGPAFGVRRHIVPDWLGNRSPLGDGRVRALLTGIGEETSERSFLEAYYATARALALQSRHVGDHLNRFGFAFRSVAVSGGHLKNPLLVRLYRDALGFDLILSNASEPVLLGTAMVAAVAAGLHADLFSALDAMAPEQRRDTANAAWSKAYESDYRVYLKLFSVRNDVEAAARALEALPVEQGT